MNLECVVTPEFVWEGVPATHRGVLVSEMASEHSRWCGGTQGGVRVLKMPVSTRVLRRHLGCQPATLGTGYTLNALTAHTHYSPFCEAPIYPAWVPTSRSMKEVGRLEVSKHRNRTTEKSQKRPKTWENL